ncbi:MULTISPECIES: ROK family transcriptional regulator [unclassified Streptomyces]|uniref:ROK family transcriptional regulator n=1 Tax=unclassified Streptomyces TaxID=2593676 RepID=UPI001F04F1DE|nr:MULTISPECIES: ROK family transcriptional regulator [unclassified Streptomyces]MCH0563769.1 ROK family transcriptional regulator [Streptomyces sp. MUM 2J]MCH0570054.1 ROK family transcriptional regulator [Streptomyces sp. MUM 136J]
MNRTNGGVNLPALRSHNTALVLDLLRTAGERGISRLELAERTGLTPQAVSKITARLRAGGLAAEAGRRASTGGKPRTVLRLVPEAGHAVGVHLDRDEVRAVLVDLTGRVVAERMAAVDLDGAGAEAAAAAVAGQAEPLTDAVRSGTLLGAGVALPGPLDHARGVLHRVTGFPQWEGFPLREALAERLGVPVVVDKDTNAAALGLAIAGEDGGEQERGGPEGGGRSGIRRGGTGQGGVRPGGGRGRSFAYLHLATGLGAGLVIGGAVHRGARTGAGEFGHQVIQLDGPRCGCGDRGCIEALCLAAVARGDTAEAARVLGAGAANLVGLLDIDRVLLGGRTVAAAPEVFVRGVGDVLRARARREGAVGGAVPVRMAGGGERRVAAGAAQLVLGAVFGRGDG